MSFVARLTAIWLIATLSLTISAKVSPLGAAAQPGYREAEQVFDAALPIDQRILFQVLMTASGEWNLVPATKLTPQLFGAIKRFQSDNGFAPTGIPDEAFFDRLFLLATPMLDLWGFQWVEHPTRGHSIWVPLGLGLEKKTNEYGLVFNDKKKRIRIDYTTVPNVTVADNYAAITNFLHEDGAHINYSTQKPDWYAISFRTKENLDGYMRFHQDGRFVTGFSLYWDNSNGNINGERIAVLMSASIRSSIGGSKFIDPPHNNKTAGVTPSAPPQQPVRPQKSEDRTPKSEVPKVWSGSGFFVSHDGSFVTNAHVIKECSKILIKTDDASVEEAKLIAEDTINDLAILRLHKEQKKIAMLRVGPRLGESVAAFGFPHSDMLSSSGNFTLGNITALSGMGDDSRLLQISAPVQSGNSGGPLLDHFGNVVGVVTSKLNALKVAAAGGDLPQNVNFAVKAAILTSFLSANNVAFESAPPAQKALEPPDIADQARAVSGFVLCK